MSYSVKKQKDKFTILEKESNIFIELNSSEKEVRDICRKLNLGAGFCGWTPTFFSKKTPNAKYTCS